MLLSTACTCANTNTPVVWTSGSGMFRERATSRVASLSSQLSRHGIMPAAEGEALERELRRMVIS